MLKPICQKENVNGPLRFEQGSLGKAVPANTKQDAIMEAKFHQLDFVTSSVYAAVATAEYRNSLPFREKLLSEPDNHRRFPCASDSKIPHADYLCFQSFLLQPTVRVEPNAKTNSTTIQSRKWPEQRSQRLQT